MSGGWPLLQEWTRNQSINTSTSGSAAAGLTVSTTSQNVKNTWTQLTASTTGDINTLEVFVGGTTLPIFTTTYTDIAVGPAGAEQLIINNLAVGYGQNAIGAAARFAFPISIPNGTRIAGRFALSSSTTTTTTVTPRCMIMGYETGMAGLASAAGVDSVGQTNGTGTVLLTSSTANKLSPYYQLTAATTQDYAGFVLGFDGPLSALNMLIDVAVGAGGTEKDVVSNYYYAATTQLPGVSTSFPIMVPIPKGTRVSARAQSSFASGLVNLTVYGIYA